MLMVIMRDMLILFRHMLRMCGARCVDDVDGVWCMLRMCGARCVDDDTRDIDMVV